jgi:hypothetical protein
MSNHLADFDLVFVTADEFETLALPRTVVQSVVPGDIENTRHGGVWESIEFGEHLTRWGVPPPVEDSIRFTVHSNGSRYHQRVHQSYRTRFGHRRPTRPYEGVPTSYAGQDDPVQELHTKQCSSLLR